MKLRVGNACWHAGHIVDASLCYEAGFYAQEGLDAEVIHAKLYTKGLESVSPAGSATTRWAPCCGT